VSIGAALGVDYVHKVPIRQVLDGDRLLRNIASFRVVTSGYYHFGYCCSLLFVAVSIASTCGSHFGIFLSTSRLKRSLKFATRLMDVVVLELLFERLVWLDFQSVVSYRTYRFLG
jgi:hypothetical protein